MTGMECNKDEAVKAKEIAEKKFKMKDIAGAKKFALKAQSLYPEVEGISQMLATFDVYIAAENEEENWYEILNASLRDDKETLKSRYKRLALMLHPDKNSSIGAEGAFKYVLEAWEFLSDNEKRAAYDHRKSLHSVYEACTTGMECNKDEAVKAKKIAEKKFKMKDIAVAKKFALRAQSLYPEVEGVSQMLATFDVYIAAENKVDEEENWYGILNASPRDYKETLKRKYEKLALMLHPDKNSSIGAEGAFKYVSEAWKFLSDIKKRGAYDRKCSCSREKNVYMVKLAEQAERFEEMVEFMEKVAKTVDFEELTVEERNLLSVAYKNVIGARRASWRIIYSLELKEESKGNEGHVAIIKDYRGKIETELSKICDGILNVLEAHLIPSASLAESKVFYLKMKGDYLRYLTEFKAGAERNDAAVSTLVAYKSAQDIAIAELAPTHPIRLDLALNYSEFYNEILNSPDQAYSLAKQALDEAIVQLEKLGEESYKDSTLIMKLLRDNLTLWSSDITDEAGDERKQASSRKPQSKTVEEEEVILRRIFSTFIKSKMSTESSREMNVCMAKLAEQAERYEEMVEFMEKVAETGDVEELTVEERNLLSVACKNVIGARRASWRIICSIEQKEESKGNEDHVAIIKDYRGKIETELSKICDGIFNVLDLPSDSASSAEYKLFCLKTFADFNRYLTEFMAGAERNDATVSTLVAYKSAQDIAIAELAPTHPIRLGIALNYSEFYYKILNSPDGECCSLAKETFDNMIAGLDEDKKVRWWRYL